VGTAKALEFGANYSPLLAKRRVFLVTTADHLPAEELRDGHSRALAADSSQPRRIRP